VGQKGEERTPMTRRRAGMGKLSAKTKKKKLKGSITGGGGKTQCVVGGASDSDGLCAKRGSGCNVEGRIDPIVLVRGIGGDRQIHNTNRKGGEKKRKSKCKWTRQKGKCARGKRGRIRVDLNWKMENRRRRRAKGGPLHDVMNSYKRGGKGNKKKKFQGGEPQKNKTVVGGTKKHLKNSYLTDEKRAPVSG